MPNRHENSDNKKQLKYYSGACKNSSRTFNEFIKTAQKMEKFNQKKFLFSGENLLGNY